MSKVIDILMERDHMTKKEATSLFNRTKRDILACIEDGDFDGAEDVLYMNVGLELDYIHEFIY